MAHSKYNHKSHNVSLLLYQIVCPAKYRRVVFSDAVDETLKDTCIEISKRYQNMLSCDRNRTFHSLRLDKKLKLQ